jgi:hypothetical protein
MPFEARISGHCFAPRPLFVEIARRQRRSALTREYSLVCWAESNRRTNG